MGTARFSTEKLLCMTVFTALALNCQAAVFQGLGVLEDFDSSSASAISDDGSTVVGTADLDLRDSSFGDHAYRWTGENGMVLLSNLPGAPKFSAFGASAISGDGSVIAGYGSPEWFTFEAALWDQNNLIVGLGHSPGGTNSNFARAVSRDGSVVVGYGFTEDGQNTFRWTAQSGVEDLNDISSAFPSNFAEAVSADGNVIVGTGESDVGRVAWRWTSDGGVQFLGDLSGGLDSSTAQAVSPDGSFVVGNSRTDAGREAFIWDSLNGMRGLRDLDGGETWSVASDVTADGSIVVGTGSIEPWFDPFYLQDEDRKAFIWDSVNGMRGLQEVLSEEYGLDLQGWYLLSATAITPDGTTIVGNGKNPSGVYEAWIVKLSPPLNTAIDVKPRNPRNRIDPRSRRGVRVAILTENDFDALQVDPGSVHFGPKKAQTARIRVRDVDQDLDPDLEFRFSIRKTGISCGDTEVTLSGRTYGGETFTGTDSITTVRCR